MKIKDTREKGNCFHSPFSILSSLFTSLFFYFLSSSRFDEFLLSLLNFNNEEENSPFFSNLLFLPFFCTFWPSWISKLIKKIPFSQFSSPNTVKGYLLLHCSSQWYGWPPNYTPVNWGTKLATFYSCSSSIPGRLMGYGPYKLSRILRLL